MSAQGYVGLYLSCKTLPEAVSSYQTAIMQSGGIYLANGAEGPILKATTTEGKTAFKLSSGISYIGGWNFAASCLYTGETPTVTGAFASENNITLSPDGLRGYKFRLEANGSGAIAGGNISWNEAGDITFVGTKMKWAGTNTTIIDANGIFTGKISADNITAGTISTASIKCEDKWALNTNGSGYLAAGNISWASDGSGSLAGGKIAWQTDGILRMTGWVQPTILEITDSNMHQYMIFTDSYSYFDISKTGCLIYIKANLSSQGEYANVIWLPSVPGYLFPDTNDEFNKTRTLLGATFSLYNFSTEEITFVSWDYTLKQAELRSWIVKPGHFVVLTCGMSTYTPSDSKEPLELIGWHGVTGKTWISPT